MDEPLKCAFGVFSGKFLEFTIQRKGIDFDLAKANAIQDTEPPTTCKQKLHGQGLLCAHIRPGLG